MTTINIASKCKTRPCDVSFALNDGAVYADFRIADKRMQLIRISYDVYGCCKCANRTTLMPADMLLHVVKNKEIEDEAALIELLKRYFAKNKAVLWEDALQEHDLLP